MDSDQVVFGEESGSNAEECQSTHSPRGIAQESRLMLIPAFEPLRLQLFFIPQFLYTAIWRVFRFRVFSAEQDDPIWR